MRKYIILILAAVLLYSLPVGAINWEFTDNVLIRGDLTVDGSTTLSGGYDSDNVAITGGAVDNILLQGVSSAYYDPTSSIQNQIDAKQDVTTLLTAIVGGTSSTGVPWNDNGTVTWKGLVDFFALFGIMFNAADNTVTFGGEVTVPQLNTTCSYADNTCGWNAAVLGRPASAVAGDCIYDNTIKRISCYNGSGWDNVAVEP